MKLLVAAITFAMTMGVLFLVDNRKTADTAEKNYAQILEGLSATENPTATPRITAKKISSKTQITIPTSTATIMPPIQKATVSNTSTPQTTATLATTATPLVSSPTPSPVSMPATTSTPLPTSTPSPESTSYQIEIVSITPPPPVKQNSMVRLDVKTAPEAQCGIKVTLPSGNQSTAKGLEPKTADGSGTITWSWRINWNTKPGTATIDINCTKDGQNFSKTFQMEIVE